MRLLAADRMSLSTVVVADPVVPVVVVFAVVVLADVLSAMLTLVSQ